MDQVTVTAKTGPARQVTAEVLQNVEEIKFDLKKEVLTVFQTAKPPREFDLHTVATTTFSISGTDYTMVVSE